MSRESRLPLDIVVVGASFAGIAVAHRFLDGVLGQLGGFEGAPTYRIILISPSTHLYWNICAPRSLVSPHLIRPEDMFIPIEPAFAQHSFNEFTFIQGWATGIDTSAKRVTVDLVRHSKESKEKGFSRNPRGQSNEPVSIPFTRDLNYRANATDCTSRLHSIQYHALILASGSSAYSPLYSLHGSHEDTLADLKDFHRKLETAHSVMVVGGGPSGVETAGQLALYYTGSGRRTGFNTRGLHLPLISDPNALDHAHSILFPLVKNIGKTRNIGPSPVVVNPRERQLERNNKRDSGTSGGSTFSRPTTEVQQLSPSHRTPKTITLLSGGERLLPKLSQRLGHKAEKQLKTLGIHIVHNLREVSHTENTDGTTNCILNNDMTITSDVLISATGVYPNTRYLPEHMLDTDGYVITDPRTLRVQGPGTGGMIYAVGDCASYSRNYTLDVYEAVPVLMTNLQNDLLAYEYKLQTVTSVPTVDALAKTSSFPEAPISPIGQEEEVLPWNDVVRNTSLSPAPTVSSTGKEKQKLDIQFSPALPLSHLSPTHRSHLSEIRMPPRTPPTPAQSKPSSPTSTYFPTTIASASTTYTNPPAPPTTQTTSISTFASIPKRALLTSGEARHKIDSLEDVYYEQVPSDTQLMPITRYGGVGVIFDWVVPSYLVYLLKGRNYRLKRAKRVVDWGSNPYAIK